MEGPMVPHKFFVTAGAAQDGASQLNAFDLALKDAGLSQCNLVPVSSILPTGCEEIQPIPIPVGAITFCVLGKAAGNPGERVGCGLAWAWGTTREGESYGIVAEHNGYCDEAEAERILHIKLNRMAEVREMTIDRIRTSVRSVQCKDYGSVVSVLVLVA